MNGQVLLLIFDRHTIQGNLQPQRKFNLQQPAQRMGCISHNNGQYLINSQHSVINLLKQKRKCITHYKTTPTLRTFILTQMNAPYFSPASCYGDRSILSITEEVIMHAFHSAYITASTSCSIWPYAVFLRGEGCLLLLLMIYGGLLLSAALCSDHSALSFNYLPANER